MELGTAAGFPVTKGSWLGEGEVLRELVAESEPVRRTVSAEARSVVNVIFLSTEVMGRLLFENPQVLQDLLTAHLKRFGSSDMPGDLRASLRFSDEWENRVLSLIDELSKSKAASDLFSPRTADKTVLRSVRTMG